MTDRDQRQLIDLLNEKISRLLYELAEQRREIRRLKKTIRTMEKAAELAENRPQEGGI